MKVHNFSTSRLSTAVRFSGPQEGEPLLLIHSEVSSSRFFEELMTALPDHYRLIAPDLRGHGHTATLPVDATRGLGDFADDIYSLVETLNLVGSPVHFLGWSLGGGVAMQYAIDHPDQVASLTLSAPVSPYGFGGTRGLDGELVWPDAAGSGGGTANPDFVKRLAASDRNEANPASPRSVMNNFYFKPSFELDRDQAEAYVAAMNQTQTGPANYPGDSRESDNWPYVAPGSQGVLNALAPLYCDLSSLADIKSKPPVLWVRGDSDKIVSDSSLFDLGYLGRVGVVSEWPGSDVYPAQPMVSQTRAVLEQYSEAGGHFEEEVLQNCGHAPHIEAPESFLGALSSFVRRHRP